MSTASSPFHLNIWMAFAVWLGLTTVVPLIYLWSTGAMIMPNTAGISVLFFNNLNLLICYCEIILGLRISEIRKDYTLQKEKYKGKEVEGAVNFLTMPLPNPFSPTLWSKMWSTYSLYDPSYQNYESFGFFIDFGNGISTILPCLLWNYVILFGTSSNSSDSTEMTKWLLSPLLVGCIGIASYWQILYGTIIYWLSFVFNRRYRGFSFAEIMGFVGMTNALWFFFPMIGIYASVYVLRDGDFSVITQ